MWVYGVGVMYVMQMCHVDMVCRCGVCVCGYGCRCDICNENVLQM